MIKTLYSLVLCLLALPTLAQIQPGAIYTGAYLSGGIKRDGSSTKTTTVNFSPMAAYMVSSHWMLGLQAITSSSRSESDIKTSVPVSTGSGYSYHTTQSTVKSKNTTIGFGPMARYYTMLSPKFAFFAEGMVSYVKTKYKLESELSQFIDPVTGSPWGTPPAIPINWSQNSNENNQGSINGVLAPGLVYFPTPKFGLELKANWFKYTYTDQSNAFDADLSLAKATVGAGYYF